jgi:hypothetical protein
LRSTIAAGIAWSQPWRPETAHEVMARRCRGGLEAEALIIATESCDDFLGVACSSSQLEVAKDGDNIKKENGHASHQDDPVRDRALGRGGDDRAA